MIDNSFGDIIHIRFPSGRQNTVLVARNDSKCKYLRELHEFITNNGFLRGCVWPHSWHLFTRNFLFAYWTRWSSSTIVKNLLDGALLRGKSANQFWASLMKSLVIEEVSEVDVLCIRVTMRTKTTKHYLWYNYISVEANITNQLHRLFQYMSWNTQFPSTPVFKVHQGNDVRG